MKTDKSIDINSMKLDEKKLVERILKGDEKALLYFYRRFRKPLFSFIKKKVASTKDTEEILQDTLFATIEALRDFSFKSSLFTFICSIANHKIIDFYRKKKLKRVVFSKLVNIEPFLSNFISNEDKLNEALLRKKINQTFAKIAPKYKKILELKYIYGYTVKEVAEILSISFKSAESRLFRARKAFVQAFS